MYKSSSAPASLTVVHYYKYSYTLKMQKDFTSLQVIWLSNHFGIEIPVLIAREPWRHCMLKRWLLFPLNVWEHNSCDTFYFYNLLSISQHLYKTLFGVPQLMPFTVRPNTIRETDSSLKTIWGILTVLWEAQRTSTTLLFNETTKLACKTMYPTNTA